MALLFTLPFCAMLLILSSAFGWQSAFGPNAHKKLRCIIQDSTAAAKSISKDKNIRNASDAINAFNRNFTVEECKIDETFCFELTGCRVDINGINFDAIAKAGQLGCVNLDKSDLKRANRGLCPPLAAEANNCEDCRVCQGNVCNTKWFGDTEIVQLTPKTSTTTMESTTTTTPTTSSTTAPYTTTESTTTTSISTTTSSASTTTDAPTQKSTNAPFHDSTSLVPESTVAPGSGSIGTAPVSAMMALLGLLTLGAVVF